MKRYVAVILFAGLVACQPAPQPPTPPIAGPIPDTGISLTEGVCFGTCPAYRITVYPNEFYQLDLRQFTRMPGTMETGTLPAGSFAAANAALQAASFITLPTDITIGSPACGGTVVSDLPRASIEEVTIAGPRIVDYYPGCFDAPDRPALETLLTSLRGAFGIPALIEP